MGFGVGIELPVLTIVFCAAVLWIVVRHRLLRCCGSWPTGTNSPPPVHNSRISLPYDLPVEWLTSQPSALMGLRECISLSRISYVSARGEATDVERLRS